uniref:Uncharacterized protein n=1 Tax=Oryza glumipatula TaxID=40148 RepID=A0A0D9YVX0_9ORYZ
MAMSTPATEKLYLMLGMYEARAHRRQVGPQIPLHRIRTRRRGSAGQHHPPFIDAMLPRRLRPLAAPSCSPAGHQPRPAAARARQRTQLLRSPARGEGRREQEKWRGEGKMRMTHGAHVGPMPSQLPRQIKSESKPPEDQK